MTTDVAETPRNARPLRIGSPLRLLVIILCFMQPALQIFTTHAPHLAQLTAGDHVPSLPHHGITRIVVGQGKLKVLGADEITKDLGLIHTDAYRLVAHNMEPCIERASRDWKVRVIGCRDHHKVHAIVAIRFGFKHCLIGGVTTLVG